MVYLPITIAKFDFSITGFLNIYYAISSSWTALKIFNINTICGEYWINNKAGIRWTWNKLLTLKTKYCLYKVWQLLQQYVAVLRIRIRSDPLSLSSGSRSDITKCNNIEHKSSLYTGRKNSKKDYHIIVRTKNITILSPLSLFSTMMNILLKNNNIKRNTKHL